MQQNKATSSTDTSSDIPRKARWADGRAGEDDCRIADLKRNARAYTCKLGTCRPSSCLLFRRGGRAPTKIFACQDSTQLLSAGVLS